MASDAPAPLDADLLRWLPLGAARVLHVSDQASPLEQVLKARCPGAKYRRAPGNLAGVKGAFDAILLDNILQPLEELDVVLSRLRALLAPTGYVLLGIPNATHWTLLGDLLQGSANRGALLNQSRPLLTFQAVLAGLGRAGLNVLKARPLPSREQPPQPFIDHLAEAAGALGVQRHEFLDRVTTRRYLLAAQRAEQVRDATLRLHVCALAPRFLDVRARLPAEFLDADPTLSCTFAELSLDLPPIPPGIPKIAVIQRLAVTQPEGWKAWTRDRIREGWVLVAEQDDHPDLMAAVHGRPPDPNAWLPVSTVHAAQTSTEPLAAAMREHTGEVAVFQNAVFELPPLPERRGPLRVFFGALNREGISRPTAESLAPFIAAHPDTEFQVVHDRAFFDALPTKKKRYDPPLPYEDYLARMGTCDIVLMPLEGTFGETFKSDIKFLEAASRGAVAVASPTVYARTIRDGETGFIAREMQDWPRILSRLAGDAALRRRVAAAARAYVVAERMFAGQVARRRDWYRSLWNRRQELQAALARRHPELAG